MKKIYTKSILAFTSFMFCIFTSNAQWSTDPNIDDTLFATVYNAPTFCSDGHGGAFFTWSQTFTGQTHDIILNRIDSLGYLHFGDSGLLIRRNLKGFVPPGICEDGHGGCYVAFGDEDLPGQPLICHHIDGTGNKLWGSNGKQVTEKLKSQYYQTSPVLINNNNNGVMLAFITNIAGSDTCNSCTVGPSGLYAQQLNFNGAKKWGANGKVIEAGSDERAPTIIKDGYNGMAVMWSSYSTGGQGYTLRMNRLNANGQLRFTAGSRELNTAAKIGYGPAYRFILSKNKNYIAVWNIDGIAHHELYAQKVDSSGNCLWGSTEIKFRDTTGEVRYPNLVTDNKDGAFISWIDGRKINVSFGLYAQHLNKNGVKKFAAQGKAIDTAASANFPQILADTASGFKVYWIPSIDNRMHTQQIKSDGTFRLAGTGPALSRAGNVPFYISVQPASDNHDILFLKTAGNGKCYAKYVPFNTILPLTLLSFNGTSNAKVNLLNWQTTSEINTNYFSVERNDDGNHFSEITRVKSNNNSTVNNYNYSDASSSNKDVYYRLKSVDADGRFTYSKIISIHQHNNTSFRIIPNPATTNCVIYFDEQVNSALRIFDRNGSLQKQMLLAPKQTQVSLDVSAFTAGTYFCIIESAGKTLTQKLIIVK